MSQGTSHYLTVRGVNFHYVEWGGTGTPLVLIHGLASTVQIWELVAPLLTAHGRVIALDQRGHGLTSQPDAGYDFASIVADLYAVVTALELEPFFLIGHSWGAYVALAFAHQHGKRLTGIGLIDGGVMDLKTQLPTWAVAEQHMTPPPLSHQTVAETERKIKEQWLGDAWTPVTGAAAFSVYKVDADGFVQRRLATPNHMAIARAIWAYTPSTHFAEIPCPVLLAVPVPPGMTALDAWQTDKQNQVHRAQQQFCTCQVVWFPETIHDIPWQRPQALAAAIVDFLVIYVHEEKQ